MRHHRFTADDLHTTRCSAAVIDAYARWCDLAGFNEESNQSRRVTHLAEKTLGNAVADAEPTIVQRDTAVSEAVGRTDLQQLTLVDLESRYHVRGGHIALLEQRLSDAARHIVDLEGQLERHHAAAGAEAVGRTDNSRLDALTRRVDNMSQRLDEWADVTQEPPAATSAPVEVSIDRTDTHRRWQAAIESSTSPGSRVGLTTEITEQPRGRHLNVISGTLSFDALRLWAANGLDALSAPPDQLDEPPRLQQIRSSIASLGWPVLTDGTSGTVWSTTPVAPRLATLLSDLCDDVELRTGRPASVLDAMPGGLDDLLAERALFRPGPSSSLLPATVDLVIRETNRAELDAVSRDLCVTVLDEGGVKVTRAEGRGRIPTVSLLLTGSHERFVRYLIEELPSWWSGEVLTDVGDLTPRHDEPIRVLSSLPNEPWPRLEAMLDAARGEFVVAVIGRRLPARGAIAALLDALLHDQGDPPLDIAYGRCLTTDDEPFPVRESGRWVAPWGTRWTTRHRTDAVASPVIAVRRAFWAHREPAPSRTVPSTSLPDSTIDSWQPEVGAALDGWLERAVAGSSAIWVADSRWTVESDLPVATTAELSSSEAVRQ